MADVSLSECVSMCALSVESGPSGCDLIKKGIDSLLHRSIEFETVWLWLLEPPVISLCAANGFSQIKVMTKARKAANEAVKHTNRKPRAVPASDS